jgi:drug/metabolite transporter (DMT)-like permease
VQAASSRVRRYSWEIGLIAITAVWGFTFPIVKCALERCPEIRGGLGLASVAHPTRPLMFISLRFAIATVIVGAVSLKALREMTRHQFLIACLIGAALCGGFIFQTTGLERTSASNTGFLTGMYVILTPLLGAAVLRRVPPLSTAAGAILAFAGLLLITSPSGIGLRLGDGLVLGCAVLFSVHLLLLGRFAGAAPLRALVTVQLAFTAVATGVASAATERTGIPTEGGVWVAILITAVLASALAFFIQTGAQRFIPPARTAVILVMESPFAALFGFAMLDERLGVRGWMGAALIVAGLLVAELFAPEREAL